VDYNQECVVEMYDGSLVNVVDGPVSCTYLRSRQTDNCGNYLVHWIVDSGNGAERRWRGCISIPSGNIPPYCTILLLAITHPCTDSDLITTKILYCVAKVQMTACGCVWPK
jgi:hypothetical protein